MINFALYKPAFIAFPISSKLALQIGGLATKIISQPGIKSARISSTQTRTRLFARFRSTALDNDRLVVTPTRIVCSEFSAAIRTTSGWAYDLPISRTRLKSAVRVRRKLRFTHHLSASILAKQQTGNSDPCLASQSKSLPFHMFYTIVGSHSQLVPAALAPSF
jgi:hypothetical protein